MAALPGEFPNSTLVSVLAGWRSLDAARRWIGGHALVGVAATAVMALAAACALGIEMAVVVCPLAALFGAVLAAHGAGHLAATGGALDPGAPHPGRGGLDRRLDRCGHEQEAAQLAVIGADRGAGDERFERVTPRRTDREPADPIIALLVLAHQRFEVRAILVGPREVQYLPPHRLVGSEAVDVGGARAPMRHHAVSAEGDDGKTGLVQDLELLLGDDLGRLSVSVLALGRAVRQNPEDGLRHLPTID